MPRSRRQPPCCWLSGIGGGWAVAASRQNCLCPCWTTSGGTSDDQIRNLNATQINYTTASVRLSYESLDDCRVSQHENESDLYKCRENPVLFVRLFPGRGEQCLVQKVCNCALGNFQGGTFL